MCSQIPLGDSTVWVQMAGLLAAIQLLSCVQLSVTPRTAACQAVLSITNSQSLVKPMSIESVMPSNHLILCHPFLLPPSIFPGIILFKGVGSSHQVAKVFALAKVSASASVLPVNVQD